MKLTGIMPPLVTPFNADGSIAYDLLRANILKYNSLSLSGYVVLGSSGEFVYLTEDEKVKVFGFVKENAASDKLLVAGTGCESLVDTVRLTNRAADAGADVALVITPNFFKNAMTEEVFYHYYLEVAEQSKIPVLLYSVPVNTAVEIKPAVVARLAAHPNIIGMKDSAGNVAQIGEHILAARNQDFAVFTGSANVLFPALALGAAGGILALANIAPEVCLEIDAAVRAGDIVKARELQLRMISVNLAITARFGVAGMKKAMNLLGYQGGVPRKPLLPLAADKEEQLRDILVRANLI
ncbi:MAG: dihydrodipicolinate synthase family protein [Dethiobacter sp.]|jgi:4-hydroxy-2-oxoglutarate aldolase|nr:dihydrodipicolinate synthase family protein [Dethiobacter sp.]